MFTLYNPKTIITKIENAIQTPEIATAFKSFKLMQLQGRTQLLENYDVLMTMLKLY